MGGPALVGRDDLLRRLSRVLDETFAGLGRVVLLAGEPGVGKTRVALEVLDDAGRRGATTAVGACWDGAGAPGLWPWVQVLRALRSSDEALAPLLDGDRDDVGVPADFHLFEAILQRLAQVCDAGPLVVLLDDLQWADEASLSLADFLHRHAVHLPLLVVGTYRADEVARPDHQLRPALSDLAQKSLTIPLAGLDNDGIRELRDALGAATSTAEAEHLRRLTGGNPFFVIESVAFRDPGESLGVRRAVDRRVDALGEGERRVLTVASLIGREAPDALVGAVIGDPGAVAASFAVVERAGLLRGDDGRHVFVHDLVREAMRDRTPADEQRALYAAIVRAADAPELAACLLPAQLAWIAMQARPDVETSRVVALLEAAAADASARLMHEAAGRHLEDAAALIDDVDVSARLTLASGDAFSAAGALIAAGDRYRSLLGASDVETRVRALLGLHRLGDPAAVGELSAVTLQLDDVDDELRGTGNVALRAEALAARSRSRAHVLADDRSVSAELAAQALDLARSSGDEATIASCLLASHDAIWDPGTEQPRRALADELADIGRRSGDLAVEAQGLLLRMVAELELGDPAFRSTHARFDAVAESSGSARLRFVAASRRGTIATLQAELATAVQEIDAARELGERIGEPDVVGMWCDQRWLVARHTGDGDTIATLLRTLRDRGDPHWMVYDAMVAADRGDVDAATRLLPEIAALGQRWPRWAARLWDTFTVELAVLLRDEARITDLLARLEPDVGHWAVLGGGVFVHGPMALWLGRLEAARGSWSSAATWSANAEAAAQRLDAQLWVVEARTDRLVAQHALGVVDAGEVAATVALAADRGLHPAVARLELLAPVVLPASSTRVFRRDRDVWTLVFDGVEATMPDSKGLRDLHTLLANPGVDVPATTLATDAFVPGDAPPMLDARAKEAYRRRLDELDDELDRAARRGDAERADRLEREREALLHELRRAAGLGGRDRAISSERERVRKTVTARIRDTLRRLDDRHPALAAHLRSSIRTGATCSYAPAEPLRWQL